MFSDKDANEHHNKTHTRIHNENQLSSEMRYNRIIGLRKNYDIGGELICGNDRALFQHSPIDEPDSDNGANDGNIGIGIDRRKKRISRWNSTRKQMKKTKKKGTRKTQTKLKKKNIGRAKRTEWRTGRSERKTIIP